MSTLDDGICYSSGNLSVLWIMAYDMPLVTCQCLKNDISLVICNYQKS